MKWKKYTIQTTAAAEDYLSAALSDCGISGIEIEDFVPLTQKDQADMFIDFLPDLPADDGSASVSFYVEDDGGSHQNLLLSVRNAIEDLRACVDVGAGTITSSETEDLDWINNWKQYFTSFVIEEREHTKERQEEEEEKSSAPSRSRSIRIRPTWEEAPDKGEPGQIVLLIDPGISFGTGTHETTQICLRELMHYVYPKEQPAPFSSAFRAPRVLDVGCGSGILSVASLLLGAREVNGTDLDADCIASTEENLKVNHQTDRPTAFYRGNLIDDPVLFEKLGGGYDIVVANILADVIIPLAPAAEKLLRTGGIFITSGIIDSKEEAVCEALGQAGFSILSVQREGEWVGVTAKKKGDLKAEE